MFPFGRGKLDKPPDGSICVLFMTLSSSIYGKKLVIFYDNRRHRAASDWIPMSDDSHQSFYFVTF